ncbi:MerR family transcriptional regulator [Pseudoalteromonas sp. MMG013]|uniref:MerR family transcriptional regulator n=2 Tax=unclassified Pseudoalteromonas TaxID=194690 RepID=UPI001B37D20E|nr:MerR family transcriptional regulator [Pseudoalteromonas sp. MMG013]MBQ4861539.1 MerR family transcriptional regulator [Pseudoalteromonas sp. MMG013]
MLTITALARECNVSRTTILYYERMGLLRPKCRTENGYRGYGDNELTRLKSIVAYRAFGIPVAEIRPLLEEGGEQAQPQLLKNQFKNIDAEIDKLRKQQQAIVVMLQEPDMLNEQVVSKARWVEIMVSLGFDDKDMAAWHHSFEAMKPTQHQRFLESLGITAEEIKKIRML